MSTYRSWNDYFSRIHDNKPSGGSNRKSASASIDAFENAYRKKYGIWLDHHALKLTKLYGEKKAWELIQENINMLYSDERQAAAQRNRQYEFHPVPEGVRVPF